MARFIFLVILVLVGFIDMAFARIRVVASIYPLYLIAKDVGGDYVEVSYLKSLNVSPHGYEVTYGDTQAIREADVVFAVGCGIEEPLKSVLGRKKNVVYLCEKGLNDRRDPHLWLSLIHVKQRVLKLAQVFAQLDPAHSEFYRKRAWSLGREIDGILSHYRGKFGNKGFAIIDRHGAWRYLIGELNLDYIGSIETTPHREPTIKDVLKLVEKAKGRKNIVVINDAGHDPSIVDRIAGELKACSVTLYPLGRGKEKSYIEFVRFNLSELERCITIR